MWEKRLCVGFNLTSSHCHCCEANVPLSLKTAAEKEQSASQEAIRRLYCVDENIERRNHYLDLAGIENYTSKFDDTGIETPVLLLWFVHSSILTLFPHQIKAVFLPFFQNLPLRSSDRMLTLLFSITLWWSERTASPLSLPEASPSLIP